MVDRNWVKAEVGDIRDEAVRGVVGSDERPLAVPSGMRRAGFGKVL